MKMKAECSSETLLNISKPHCYIPEDNIPQIQQLLLVPNKCTQMTLHSEK
jgi:hypothetical protein